MLLLVAQAEIVFELFQDLGDIQGFTGIGEHMIILVFSRNRENLDAWRTGKIPANDPLCRLFADFARRQIHAWGKGDDQSKHQ